MAATAATGSEQRPTLGPDATERDSSRRAPVRVWLLNAVLAAVSAAVWYVVIGHVGPLGYHRIPWPFLAVALVGAGFVNVTFAFRNSAIKIGVTEIVIVVAAAFLDPPQVLLAVGIGRLVDQVLKRNPPSKSAFNTLNLVLAAASSLAAYHAVIGSSSPASLRGWLAALVVVVVTAIQTDVLLIVVIAISTLQSPRAAALATGRAELTSIPICTVLSVIAASLTWANRYGGLLLVVLAASALALQRSSTEFRRRYANLEHLYRFTRHTAGVSELSDTIPSLLSEARNVMAAAVAEMVLDLPEGFVRYRLDSDDGILRSRGNSMGALAALADEVGGGVLATRTERQPAIRAALAELGLRDALAAPLSGAEDPRGVLIVGDRNGPVSFDAEDLRLFEVLASHSAVALRGGLLLDRLKEEVAAREYEALHDALTGLANRTLFERAMESALANRTVGNLVPVMLMDLDGFKEINDTMGHHTGDAVLGQIGGRLSALMAQEGTVARLGGDEFAFVVPDLAARERVAELAQAIQEEVVRPVEVDGLVLGLRASLGVSLAPDHGEDPSILMRRADVAMYAAKTRGGGMAVYDWSTDHHSTRRLMLATELRAAGQIDQIDVWFQPQAELATGVVVGCEALARWTHPLHGVIPPEEFIPVAEQSGSLGPLTWRMLDVALRQCREWHDHGLAISVSVNISVHTLLEAGLVDRLARLLADIGIDPRWLTLELTESSIMGDPVQSGGVLSLLGQLGVSLAIDDFGTGHSSLTRLKRLPIHIVKIDKSFVTSMTADQGDAAIVRSTVELARSLGHIVVAEGVEDQVTWDRLAALGCDRAQGYHLARPMPGAAVEAWLRPRARTPLSVVRPADHVRGA